MVRDAGGYNAARAHDDAPVAERANSVHHVLDHDDADAVMPQRLD